MRHYNTDALLRRINQAACVTSESYQQKTDLEAWLANMPRSIQWNGEGIPALTQKCLLELLKAERRTPSKDEQKSIWELQDGHCNMCGGIFDGDLEWDHVARLQQTVKCENSNSKQFAQHAIWKKHK